MTTLEAKQAVMNLQGLTEFEHNENIYELGLIYLQNRKMTAKWEGSKEFWGWFKLQYNNCCFQFVQRNDVTTSSSNKRIELIKCFYEEIGSIFDTFPPRGIIETQKIKKQQKIKVN